MRRRRGSEAEGSRRSLLARRVRPADAQGRGRVRRRIQNGRRAPPTSRLRGRRRVGEEEERSMEGVASSASLMGELRAALVETQGFASAVDAAGAFLFDTPSSSPSKTSTYSRDAQGVQTGAQTVGTGWHPVGTPAPPWWTSRSSTRCADLRRDARTGLPRPGPRRTAGSLSPTRPGLGLTLRRRPRGARPASPCEAPGPRGTHSRARRGRTRATRASRTGTARTVEGVRMPMPIMPMPTTRRARMP